MPTASTSPANSLPRRPDVGRTRAPDYGFSWSDQTWIRRLKKRAMNGSALRNPQPVRLTVVAWILTSISLSLGVGRSISSSRRIFGGPYFLGAARFGRPGGRRRRAVRRRIRGPATPWARGRPAQPDHVRARTSAARKVSRVRPHRNFDADRRPAGSGPSGCFRRRPGVWRRRSPVGRGVLIGRPDRRPGTISAGPQHDRVHHVSHQETGRHVTA